MRIVLRIAVPLLVATVALTGCGGDDDKKTGDPSSSSAPGAGESSDPSSASGPLDACTLLTHADLEKAFGSPFDDGELTHQGQTGGDQCVWTNEDAPPVKTFSITVLRQGSLEGAIKSSGLSVAELHEQTKSYATAINGLKTLAAQVVG